MSHDLLDAVPAIFVPPRTHVPLALGNVLVELQPRLDQPDRICCGSRRNTGRHGTCEMYDGVGVLETRPVRVCTLARTVDVEVYTPGGHHTYHVRAQSLEKRARALYSVHVAQDLDRLGHVVRHGPQRAEPSLARCFSGGSQLRLVEVGLQAGFEDVKRCCEDSRRHSSDTVTNISS